MNETRTLATWVAGLRLSDVPDNVKVHARRFILDNFGCQIAGAMLPWSQTYYDVIRKTRSGTHSTVAYFGDKFAPDDAAFLNSAFNHANETDDTHLKSPTHPGGVAVPAALAIAEYAKADGAKLLAAVIASYEIQIRISWACSPFLIYRGHHPPPGVGTFGAAAAGTLLMGFDAEKTLNAMAIAGSHSAGLIEYTKAGGSVKRIHSAIGAVGGVRAALFAEAGITGPHSILEGEKGYVKVFAGEEAFRNLARLTDGLGTLWHMLDTAIKPHSANHFFHPMADALDIIRDREPITPEQVKSLTVYTNSEPILSHCGSITEPEDVLGAQFSTPFSLAMRLHHGGRGVAGGNGFWDYPRVNVKDPQLIATARKIKCVVAKGADWLVVDKGAGLEIETTDGRRIRQVVEYSKGMPENPLSDAEVKEKFRSLVDPILPDGRPQQIIDAVENIEKIKNIDELVQLLVVPPAKRTWVMPLAKRK
ncbi:MAG: MmgE/PrpD family protein [Betaproteobacteria bacterium]|nr:MmgE/PrpD family protein [Betaproteobacteria bacterium]